MSDDTERWLPVVGYEGYYEVSDHGRVRTVPRRAPRRNGGTYPVRARIKALVPVQDGRRVVTLSGHNDKRPKRVAVLVLEAFVGPRPSGMDCCHNDGDSANDHVSNLRWDTRSANMYDKVIHGTHMWANRTHCPRGHRLVAPNLVASKAREGRRECRACARARASQQYARHIGALFDFPVEADIKYARIMQS